METRDRELLDIVFLPTVSFRNYFKHPLTSAVSTCKDLRKVIEVSTDIHHKFWNKIWWALPVVVVNTFHWKPFYSVYWNSTLPGPCVACLILNRRSLPGEHKNCKLLWYLIFWLSHRRIDISQMGFVRRFYITTGLILLQLLQTFAKIHS